MAYQRTTFGALQQWADAVGDQSWTYDNVSSYYQKSLNFTPPDMSKRMANATPKWDSNTLGQGGPLDLTYSNQASAFSTWAAKAFEYLGMAPIDGFTSGRLFGSGWLVSTINQTSGFRESSEAAFLAPYTNRKNLALYNNTLAEKILFDGNKANGVRVNDTKKSFKLKARREVIVSSGAIQSPQLLLVSGVGPADLLKKHGIPIVADRPGVGQNLIDHVFFGIDWPVKVQTASVLSNDKDGSVLREAVKQFNDSQTGILASPGGEFAAYQDVPTDLRNRFSPQSIKGMFVEYPGRKYPTDMSTLELATLPKDWPELQFFPLPSYIGDFDWPGTQDPQDGRMYATILATLIAPMSRGNISIKSSSMQDSPLINPNWLTSQTDIDIAIAGFRRLRQIYATPALREITDYQEEYPGFHVQSDKEVHQAIKKSFQSMYHPSSTCKMGKGDDPSAVVDSQGRVIGIKNRESNSVFLMRPGADMTITVRIADASVFPFLPPGECWKFIERAICKANAKNSPGLPMGTICKF